LEEEKEEQVLQGGEALIRGTWYDKISLMLFRLRWKAYCAICRCLYIVNCEKCEYQQKAELCPFCQTDMVRVENGRFACPNELCPLSELWHTPHKDIFLIVESERQLGQELYEKIKNEREQLMKVFS
jgi:hypothetical protein